VSLQTGGPVTNSGTIVSTGAYGIRNSGIAFITNTGTGLISGYNGGVRSSSYLAASNSGTITATASTHTSVAIFFSSGSLDNSGLVSGGYAGVTVDNGTVTNTGTIKSADTHFSDAGFGDGGVRVVGNATITNTGTDGLISGYIDGIYAVGGSTVSVSNSGTIKSSANATPFGSYGIFSLGGLTLTNNGVITARKYVVDGHYDNNHVTNTGTISGGVAAVIIFGQGTVANNGGVMAGYEGVVFRDLGTVTNTGTISGTQNLSGVIFNGGGYLSNASSGIIQGVATGATVSGAAGTVVNAGTVTGLIGLAFGDFANTVIDTGAIAGTNGTAISFGTANDLLQFNASASANIHGRVDGGGGTDTLEFVANGTTANTLTGVGANFVNFSNGTIDSGAYWEFAGSNTIGSGTTLTNSGTLLATGPLTNAGTLKGSGVFIIDPTTFTNTGYVGLTTTLAGTGDVLINTSTGTINVVGNGVLATGSAATVNNLGTINGTGASGYGVNLKAGGTVTNGATNVTSAQISGSRDGIIAYNTPATITNYGTISGAAVAGVFLSKGGAVTNASGGLISSNFVGVQLSGTVAGPLVNLGGARISGASYGLRGRFNTVANAGTITGTNKAGIDLYSSGSISNTAAGLINGGTYGISINTGALTLTNDGTIKGNNYGIGVRGTGNSTVVNSGTIIGTLQGAIKFSSGNDLLVVNPGAVFVGKADGGSGSNTLELASAASAGTISGIGTSFANFGTINVDSGAQWTITGSNTIASGRTLTNSGTLTDAGSLSNSGTVNGNLTLAGGAYLNNSGQILATSGAGIVATGAATIVNSGTIDPPGSGVYLQAGGTLTNNSAGTSAAAAMGSRSKAPRARRSPMPGRLPAPRGFTLPARAPPHRRSSTAARSSAAAVPQSRSAPAMTC
jgi:hypothetical protein